MTKIVFALVEKYLGLGGWKTIAGVALFAINYIAAKFGVAPGLPGGDAGGIWQMLIDAVASQFTSGAAMGLMGLGVAHKAYKAGKAA